MSVDLDRQLREYCRQMDEQQGAFSFQDILDRAEGMPVIPRPMSNRPTPRRAWIAAATAFVVFIILIGVWFLPPTDQTPGPVDQPTTTVAPARSFPETDLEAGTYRIEPSESSVAGVTLTLPAGWEAPYGLPYAVKHSEQDGELAFYFVTVDRIFSDPCVGVEGGEIGPSVDDLVTALAEQPLTETSEPIATTLGGLPATRIDLTVPAGFDTSECNAVYGLQIWYSRPADNYFVLLEDGTASVYVLDVNGERQVFLTQYRAATSAEDIAEMQTVIDSIVIDQ